jgi:hypothetical protein
MAIVINEGAVPSAGLLDVDANEREDFRNVEELAHALIIPLALPQRAMTMPECRLAAYHHPGVRRKETSGGRWSPTSIRRTHPRV